MFECAFLQQTGNRGWPHEEALVLKECTRLGIEVIPFTAKQMQRRQLPLTRRSFVCGDMDVMHGAMKQLGIPVPPANGCCSPGGSNCLD